MKLTFRTVVQKVLFDLELREMKTAMKVMK